jgi:hypothetical protein
MKYLAAACIFILSISTAYTQHGLPQQVEQTLSRLEYAFNTSDTKDLQWVLPTSLRMRIEDSVFTNITDKYVMEMLHRYLAEKDSLEFKFTGSLMSEVDGKHTSGILPDMRFYGGGNVIKETVYIASGKLYYMSDGHHDNVEITVFIVGGVVGIDISRTPRGTAFFTSPYN